MGNKKGFRGYISSREIGGNIIPQRVQNLVIRTYAQTKGILFLLSATEYYMNNCHMMLNAVLDELDRLEGVIFYSTHLLPKNAPERRKMYDLILKSGAELHFALEELSIKNEQDIALIEELMMCRELTTNRELPSAFTDEVKS